MKNHTDKWNQLKERLDDCLKKHFTSALAKTKKEIITDAEEIYRTERMHEFLTYEYEEMSDKDIEHLLLFENPLEVTTAAWFNEMDEDSTVYEAYLEAMSDKDGNIEIFPLHKNSKKQITERKEIEPTR